MADTPESIPQAGNNGNITNPESDFLNATPNTVKSEDMLYNDFFKKIVTVKYYLLQKESALNLR